MLSPEGNTAFIQLTNQDLELEKITFLSFQPAGNTLHFLLSSRNIHFKP